MSLNGLIQITLRESRLAHKQRSSASWRTLDRAAQRQTKAHGGFWKAWLPTSRQTQNIELLEKEILLGSSAKEDDLIDA